MAVDVVALASVLSSGVVAAGSLVLTYRSAKQQREHESGLAYEERVWEAKSAALYKTITSARELLSALDSGRDEWLVDNLSRTHLHLGEQVAAVEAYASEACRAAFTDLRQRLDASRVDVLLHLDIEQMREEKMNAIDDQNFVAAAHARDQEKQLVQEAIEQMQLDEPAARQACERLITEARASLRRSDA